MKFCYLTYKKFYDHFLIVRFDRLCDERKEMLRTYVACGMVQLQKNPSHSWINSILDKDFSVKYDHGLKEALLRYSPKANLFCYGLKILEHKPGTLDDEYWYLSLLYVHGAQYYIWNLTQHFATHGEIQIALKNLSINAQ
jgi:hypothetical protein